jgi:hypothetical protein
MHIYFDLNPFAVHGADDPNLNEEVSSFNLEWSPLLSLSDNDLIDEYYICITNVMIAG